MDPADVPEYVHEHGVSAGADFLFFRVRIEQDVLFTADEIKRDRDRHVVHVYVLPRFVSENLDGLILCSHLREPESLQALQHAEEDCVYQIAVVVDQ
eukprot:CAMPEP_0168346250 /NCGR_PEP_ID=MMETSP0213-20121227/18136_1 /TAXON_ID=151035 /ORGANISM="Euplotes harpa, Strain FSP1.4" /LENGTH=96 /DNA_ID=CAMNT_0008354819 /DNA_START=10 /DNA_END=300 /DNA_ORIENTATION=+